MNVRLELLRARPEIGGQRVDTSPVGQRHYLRPAHPEADAASSDEATRGTAKDEGADDAITVASSVLGKLHQPVLSEVDVHAESVMVDNRHSVPAERTFPVEVAGYVETLVERRRTTLLRCSPSPTGSSLPGRWVRRSPRWCRWAVLSPHGRERRPARTPAGRRATRPAVLAGFRPFRFAGRWAPAFAAIGGFAPAAALAEGGAAVVLVADVDTGGLRPVELRHAPLLVRAGHDSPRIDFAGSHPPPLDTSSLDAPLDINARSWAVS
jgi:hypothetical protein